MTTDTADRTALARWRRDPASFVDEWLVDPETGKPFVLLDAERAFLAHSFRTGDDDRLLYPEQVFGAPKKSGKTTFAAIMTLVAVIVFGGRWPEAYALANDLEQAQGRVFESIRRIVEASGIEARCNDKEIRLDGGGKIVAIANDYAGAAGANPTVSVFDELWGYTSERSHRLWDEMVPPPTRRVALRLTVTYAGFEGESTLLEGLYKRGLALPAVAGCAILRAGDGMLFFWSHDPVAPWQDDAWLAQMRRQLRPNQYLRMIENRFVTTETQFIDMERFDACVDASHGPLLGAQGYTPVWVGVDASVKHDSTAVVAVALDAGDRKKVRLVSHQIFQPSPDDPIDFEGQVEAAILDLKKRFAVRTVRYDPYQMAAVAQRLKSKGVPMEEFPQTVPNLTAASQNIYELIEGGNIVLYPDKAIRAAVQQAVAKESTRGWRITKEKQSHRIDVLVALAMAAHAAIGASGKGQHLMFGWTDGGSFQDWSYWQRYQLAMRGYRTGVIG